MLRVRTHLVLMAVAILVPVLIFSALALHMLRSSVRAEALRGLSETADATALVIDREMASTVAALKLLAASPALESQDFTTFYKQACLLDHDQLSWIMLIDARGQQLLHTGIAQGEAIPQAALINDIQSTLKAQRPMASSLTPNPIDGRLMTLMYVPLRTADGRSYVLAKGFSLDFFSETAFQRKTPPGWVIGVFDHDGRTIARNFNHRARVGQTVRPELLDAIRSTGSGVIRHAISEGVDSYDAFTHSQVTGWPIAVAAPVDTVETAANRAAAVAALGFLVAIGVAVLTAGLLGRRLVQSIADASQAARDLGAGHAGRHPASSPVLELHKLQASLAQVAHTLRHEKLSRKQAETKLEQSLESEYQARRRAEAENASKDQFLAMLGHELRNPLAAISGAVALDAQASQTDAALQSETRQIIQRQSQHLAHIVDDLLDISRLAGGKITLTTQPLNLSALAEACVDALRATGRTKGFCVRVLSTPVWVQGDATRLEQSISNLLANALKFTPPGGEITLQVSAEGAEAVLRLRDTGMGIAADLLPHVFEAFTQGPASLDRSRGGLGLGLALVSQLVRLHGGTVQACSAGPGLGSTFTVRLPRITAPAQELIPIAPTPRAVEAQHLLLIEDLDDVRRMMCELLQLHGYRVMDSASAANGVRLAVETQPTVAIIDIGLPDMNGYEVARALRAHPRTQTMGLIALTGYGQKEDRKKALDAGFDVHLVKPVDMDELLGHIEACVQLVHDRQQRTPCSDPPATQTAQTAPTP